MWCHPLSLLLPSLTLSLCLPGDEYPRAHQLQKERHVLGRGGEALPQGPGDCPLQRDPRVKGDSGCLATSPKPCPAVPTLLPRPRDHGHSSPRPCNLHTSLQREKGKVEDGLLLGLLEPPQPRTDLTRQALPAVGYQPTAWKVGRAWAEVP